MLASQSRYWTSLIKLVESSLSTFSLITSPLRGVEASHFLSHELMADLDIKVVMRYVRTDVDHVTMRSGKDIIVFLS